jgi:hypothetical protein
LGFVSEQQAGLKPMADHPDYAARAVQAEEHSERALRPSLADSYRRLAQSYWALARQQTDMRRRNLNRMLEINDC